ncbi:MAG: hypothetical protein IKE42_28280 [Aquamicrobium sp.]|nr:hypothetical protein [Aquamicrobium sp.]
MVRAILAYLVGIVLAVVFIGAALLACLVIGGILGAAAGAAFAKMKRYDVFEGAKFGATFFGQVLGVCLLVFAGTYALAFLPIGAGTALFCRSGLQACKDSSHNLTMMVAILATIAPIIIVAAEVKDEFEQNVGHNRK